MNNPLPTTDTAAAPNPAKGPLLTPRKAGTTHPLLSIAADTEVHPRFTRKVPS